MNITKKRVKIKIAGSSLIGAFGDYPLGWGNYFWLSDSGRVINFWLENLEEANKQFNLNNEVDIIEYTNEPYIWTLIDDQRIPKDWYYNKLCFTGYPVIDLDTLRQIYDYIGDPDNELERYTDIVSYWTKRGRKVTIKNGIISYHYE